ncbi:MAG: type II toxin-antitoxin system VapC family toxin [Chloroflexi bacterium]|nr:type II toxin-antitoxin system VapC family toxin [Chloroflexota bacterium]
MTLSIVLDASVAIPLVWQEDVSAVVRRSVDRWVAHGRSLLVPGPFWAEVVNALTRRHGRPGSAVIEALYELDQLMIATVEIDRPLLLAGLDLVERSGLTIHDAIYLALARSTNARLATFDRELIAAGGGDVVDLWAGGELDPGGHLLREEPAPHGMHQGDVTWPTWPGAGSYLATLRRRAIADAEQATSRRP